MADRKCKIVLFSVVVLIAVILLAVLIAHRSTKSSGVTVCEDLKELYVRAGDSENGTCVPAGSKGHCGRNMVLFPDRQNKSVGACDCDYNTYNRTLIYHKGTNDCYFLFQQGYCQAGEWITVSRASPSPDCQINSCSGQSDGELVPLKDGRCVELGKPDTNCTGLQVVQFFKGKLYPACSYKPRPVSTGTVGVPPPKCPPGSYNSPLGNKCQLDFDFD